MKNNDDQSLLAHKRRVDAERKAKAVGKQRIAAHNARLAMARVAIAAKAKSDD